MNILFINHYAGSSRHGMQYRPYNLARQWLKMGHQTTVVAASFSHVRSRQPEVREPLTEEEIEGLRYLWLKTPAYAGNTARRVLNMAVFTWRLWRLARELARRSRPDLVVASSPHPFVIFGARRLARAAGARLAFEVRDLWPLTPIELGHMSPAHPFIFLMQRAENYACRVSDYVVSLLPQAAGYLHAHGMADAKFVYLPNGVAEEDWSDNRTPLPEEHVAAFSRLRREGRFLIGYAGAHGLANALEQLIEAAGLLNSEPVTFVLVGQGPHKEALQRQARDAGLDNVLFLPPVSKDAVPALLDALDVLYIGLKSESLFRFGISPNKLFDYMMAARPVIHAINAGNDLVAEAGCGLSIAPENPQQIAQAVRQLRAMTPEQRAALGRNGRQYVLAHHEYKVLARRFLEELR